ncbi:MAG: gamma carbonic anhydrase family protein [Thermodesulfobacteriota bacterium]
MILEFQGKYPKVHPTVFIAENAIVIGDVEIGSESNIWFYSILRGDLNFIRIGSRVNIQDGCILHVDKENYPLIIEDEVVLGHRVVVHGCKVRKGSLIGIGAIILNGVEIGEESIVGAGSVVTPNTIIPPKTLALGVPAKPVRSLNDQDFERIRDTIQDYNRLIKSYRK